MSITGCRYSVAGKVLVTSSIDTEVKVWSLTGGLVHTFRGHSRAVTNLLIHPHNSTIVITCSLDGSLRMWSLDTMDCIYSLVVSASGLLWMGLTDDNLLYISTARSLTLWHLNLFIHFWSLTRNQVTRLQLEGCPGKSLRVLAVGEDSSVRLFARSNQKNLSTVLPPPSISPLQKILGVCYSREFNVIFVLINPQHIWVYTTRTDPACRIAVWDVHHIQAVHLRSDGAAQDRANALLPGNKAPSHRATENGLGNELVSNCCCVCILKSSAMLWTDEGCCCPVRHSYLLLGLEDGRVLFMDPVVKGQKFMEFKVSKDPVVELQHDVEHKSLVTVCRMAQMTYVQFWGLPDLELQHEVFCAPDLTAYARIVPYEIEFSKDFLEGKLTLEPVKVEAVESEAESRLSLAPTETYLTPPPSPSSLSAVDMTLGIKGDKQKKKSMKKDAKESSPEASPGTETAETKAQLSEAEETSEEEESDVDEDLKAKLPPKKIPDLELVAPAASKAKAEKPTETVREDISAPKRSRRAIADVEIDVKSLMKERRSGVVVKKEADHAHISTALPRETSRERPHREPVKKKTVAQRKLPKRGLRPSQQDQDAAAGKDEMTQMQRLDTGTMGDRLLAFKIFLKILWIYRWWKKKTKVCGAGKIKQQNI
nr:hypothetical protein BaRGS_026190 [Batillaria attramentaria]